MSTIKEIQEEIVDEFSMFDDWMQRYEYIIELGKSLPLIYDQCKKDENLIKGCQSRVWLHADKIADKIVFTADSAAILTKGIIAVLNRVFSNHNAEGVLTADIYFSHTTGLKEPLSPTRANGLVSMIKQIKLYAIALQAN